MKATKLLKLIAMHLPYSEFSRKIPIGTQVKLPSGEGLCFGDRSVGMWDMFQIAPDSETQASIKLTMDGLYAGLSHLVTNGWDSMPTYIDAVVADLNALYPDRRSVYSDQTPTKGEELPETSPETLRTAGTTFINGRGEFMICVQKATGGLVYRLDNYYEFDISNLSDKELRDFSDSFFSGGISHMNECYDAFPDQSKFHLPEVKETISCRGVACQIHYGAKGWFATPQEIFLAVGLKTSGECQEFVNAVLGTTGFVREGAFPYCSTKGDVVAVLRELNVRREFTQDALDVPEVVFQVGDSVKFSVCGREFRYTLESPKTSRPGGWPIYWGQDGVETPPYNTKDMLEKCYGDLDAGLEVLVGRLLPFGVTKFWCNDLRYLVVSDASHAKIVVREILRMFKEWESPKMVTSLEELRDLRRDLVLGDQVVIGGISTTVKISSVPGVAVDLDHPDLNGNLFSKLRLDPNLMRSRTGMGSNKGNLADLTKMFSWIYESLEIRSLQGKASLLHDQHLADLQASFTYNVNQVAQMAHQIAKDKGFWDTERNDAEMIALMHSELSEAVEALRKDLMDDKLPNRKGVEVELSDCIIRILDYAQARGLDIPGAIFDKMAYNQTREKLHGKRF